MAKELCVEAPNQGEKYYLWNDVTKKMFALDSGDIETLEAGRILWREGTAFTLDLDEGD
jgi:hypothetical protein